MPKYSALLFYVRVFGVGWNSGLFWANTLAAAGLVTAWLLFAVPYDIFQCTPVRKAWLPLIPGHSSKTSHWYLGNATLSAMVDVYIMLLPIPILWNLHTGRKRKMILTGFFFCAYCVITCSLGRLVSLVLLLKEPDGDWTWNQVTYFYWTAAELAISIVSICLPNMTQLFRRAHRHGVSGLFTRREYAAGNRSRSNTGPADSAFAQGGKEGFQRIIGNDDTMFAAHRNPLIDTKDHSSLYTVSASAQRSEEREIIALGQVHLRQDIDVRGDERWAAV